MLDLDADLEKDLREVGLYAKAERHEFITVEHLLLALASNKQAHRLLVACGVNCEELANVTREYIEIHTPKLENTKPNYETQTTGGFTKILSHAMIYAQSQRKKSGLSIVNGGNVLVSIFHEKQSFAVYLLRDRYGVSRRDVLHQLTLSSQSIPEYLPSEEMSGQASGEDNASATAQVPISCPDKSPAILKKFTTNLNVVAQEGKIDPLIGRRNEIEKMIQTLCQKRKCNPLLVGEAGVGKTALAQGLAYKIVQGEITPMLKDAVIYSLDIGLLVSGTKYRGDFEKRFSKLLVALESDSNSILFIDEIHMLVGAGSSEGHSMDAANLIKPKLQARNIRCIGSTTCKDYKRVMEKDRALTRRFQKIEVLEPSVRHAYQILKGLKPIFENFHKVSYSRASLLKAVQLTDRYIHEKFLPDKAVDVIDQAAAKLRVFSSGQPKNILVKASHIEEVVARHANVPIEHIRKSEINKLEHLKEKMQSVIFGQDEALNKVVSAVQIARSGIGDASKPMGSFLFVGPTGVGKTEVARQLALQTSLKLLRFDMSEFMEKHSVSRLIGAPPGYVGFDNGGQLTDAVARSPYSLVLLDEIEKAHHDIYNILLQVMDHGKLTDTSGKEANFTNCILVMTSNSGASQAEQGGIGFAKTHGDSSNFKEKIKKVFTPEFRNRLDAVVCFNSLDLATMECVLDKFLIELQARMDEKRVEINLSKAARSWFIKHGYIKAMGARPLRRLVEDKITKAVVWEILFGQLKQGGKILCDVVKNELIFSFEARSSFKATDKNAPAFQYSRPLIKC